MSSRAVSSALLLVGHGTRSEAGRAELLRTAEMVAARLPGVPVQHCYLELAEPTISDALSRLAERGVRRVVVVPILLFAAGHAKRDIPKALETAAARFPGLTYSQTLPFACDEEILELSAMRFRETEQNSDAALILVGRGSLDAEAIAEIHRFTALRAERTPVELAIACFLAMSEPRLDETIKVVAQQSWRRIVVQPHLLFQGELLDQLRETVATARLRWPDREWIVASHLGPAPLLAECIVRRFQQG